MRRILAVVALAASVMTAAEAPSPECEDARVQYSAPASTSLSKLMVSHLSWSAPELQPAAALEKVQAPQHTRWFVLIAPDTARDGPWNTEVLVFSGGRKEPPLRIRFADHASYGVRTSWINDDLLYMEVSWGRMKATSLILDVKSRKWIYAMDARFDEVMCERIKGR
jgi:hypothetical protein